MSILLSEKPKQSSTTLKPMAHTSLTQPFSSPHLQNKAFTYTRFKEEDLERAKVSWQSLINLFMKTTGSSSMKHWPKENLKLKSLNLDLDVQ